MTALFLGCMKIYGAVGFQAAAPAGHRSDDVRLRRAARAAGPGWCMAATGHPSHIRAPQLPRLARLSTPAGPPGSKHAPSSRRTPTITASTTCVLRLGGGEEMLVRGSSGGASEGFWRQRLHMFWCHKLPAEDEGALFFQNATANRDCRRGLGLSGGTVVQNPPGNVRTARDVDLIPGSGRSPGGGHGNPSSILAWRVPQTEESDWLQTMGAQRRRHDSRDLAPARILHMCWCYFLHLRRSLLPPPHPLTWWSNFPPIKEHRKSIMYSSFG